MNKSKQVFAADNYLGDYELLVRSQVGKELDGFKGIIDQIENRCIVRNLNISFANPSSSPMTIDELKTCDSEYRCKTLAAVLYDDSLSRFEVTYFMVCIGLIGLAYNNLRSSIEFLQSAFIVERDDTQALILLEDNENKQIDLKLLDSLIDSRYARHLKKFKDLCAALGVHRSLSSIMFTGRFGPSRFYKNVHEKTITGHKLELPDGFPEIARKCIYMCNQVGLLFLWLESLPIKTS